MQILSRPADRDAADRDAADRDAADRDADDRDAARPQTRPHGLTFFFWMIQPRGISIIWVLLVSTCNIMIFCVFLLLTLT